MPSERKMDTPKYGTNPTSQIPVLPLGNADGAAGFARLLAGPYSGTAHVGPFTTIADVQMLDLTLLPSTADEPVRQPCTSP